MGRLDGFAPVSIAVVVPCMQLAADGTLKEEMIERILAGIEVAENSRSKETYLVFAGGLTGGKEAEAAACANWARHLVSDDLAHIRILAEARSTNTVENAVFVRLLLEHRIPAGRVAVVVVSDFEHLIRAGVVFRNTFADEARFVVHETGFFRRDYGHRIDGERRGLPPIVAAFLGANGAFHLVPHLYGHLAAALTGRCTCQSIAEEVNKMLAIAASGAKVDDDS